MTEIKIQEVNLCVVICPLGPSDRLLKTGKVLNDVKR